jgi:hypothetical protein
MSQYPNRDPYFSHKFTRLLTKLCVANELGPDVFTLLVIVAHTEDSRRYQGPVNWYNEQLLPLCGFRNVKALDRARTAAVEAGWLHYETGGKSKPGKYWVLQGGGDIELDSNATDVDESDLSPVCLVENDQRNGIETDLKGNRVSFETDLTVFREGNSYPLPSSPVPGPLPNGASRANETPKKNPGPSGFIVPDHWDTPSVHAALTLWSQHYPSKHNGATFGQVNAAMLLKNRESEGWTPEVFCKSVELSVGEGWSTITDYRKVAADKRRRERGETKPINPQIKINEIPIGRGIGNV